MQHEALNVLNPQCLDSNGPIEYKGNVPLVAGSFADFTEKTIETLMPMNTSHALHSPPPIRASVTAAINLARSAQLEWADMLPRHRLKLVANVAAQIVIDHRELISANPRPNSSPAEILSSEVFPLADACRFTFRVAKQALAPVTRSFRHGAWWMGRVGVRVTRQPWGTILILAPSNYPLFIPGVQMVQALAAGNAVVVKPAPGCTAIVKRFAQCLSLAGIPSDLVQIIDESIEAGQAAIKAGVNKVILTGSAATGRSVLAQLSSALTPATMELSGCDAVFVMENADLQRLASCLVFALRLNGGATCIAPRRVFATATQLSTLSELLQNELQQLLPTEFVVPSAAKAKIMLAARAAINAGAQVAFGEVADVQADEQATQRMTPLIMRDVDARQDIAREDFFGPVLSLVAVPDMKSAIAASRLCPYGLGASIFGPTRFAEYWARQIQAGCIVINDIIVPTADPRVAFGGIDQSGWGVTRGWEGLLEMSRPQVTCTRHGNWLPHLDQRRAHNVELLSGLLRLFHGRGLRTKLTAIREIVGSIRQ